MLAESRDAWGPIPKDRFNVDGFAHPDSNRTGTVGGPSDKLETFNNDLATDLREVRTLPIRRPC